MNELLMGAIVPLSILLPLFYGFSRWERLGKTARIILVYLLISAGVNLAADMLVRNRAANLPLLHVYTAVEFIVLVMMYRYLLAGTRAASMVTGLQVGFALACIANAIWLQSMYTFNSYSLSLGAIIIMLLAINYFARLAVEVPVGKVSDLPDFWFNTALFLYFSGSCMLYVFSNFFLQVTQQEFYTVWGLHAIFVMLMYILFSIGFIKCKR